MTVAVQLPKYQELSDEELMEWSQKNSQKKS